MNATPPRQDGDLRRELTTLDATMINIGSMIGSGIFIAPASVAACVASPGQAAAVWAVAGVVSLFGALAVAELGVRLPFAGGQYVYLKEAYGPLAGFLYGWAAFLVINTASIAAVAVTFAVYLTNLTGGGPAVQKSVAVGSVVLLTAVNCFGIKLGAMVQNVFTFGKIAIIAGLAAIPLFIGFPAPAAGPAPASQGLLGAFALALIPALFAYDGWIEITYVAGEVRDPRRALPRSLVLGTVAVVALYVGLSTSLVALLGYARTANSPLVAAEAATVAFGAIGSSIIAAAVAVSTFGANNGFIFTCPRIYYAMAREGLFFRWIGRLHPRTRTPVLSLVAQGVLSTALILSGTFEQLASYVVFSSFLFYGLSAGAVIILRRRQPAGGDDGFRVWGYPFTVILFILFSLFLTVAMVISDPASSLVGLGIVASGIPMYYYWRRNS